MAAADTGAPESPVPSVADTNCCPMVGLQGSIWPGRVHTIWEENSDSDDNENLDLVDSEDNLNIATAFSDNDDDDLNEDFTQGLAIEDRINEDFEREYAEFGVSHPSIVSSDFHV